MFDIPNLDLTKFKLCRAVVIGLCGAVFTVSIPLVFNGGADVFGLRQILQIPTLPPFVDIISIFIIVPICWILCERVFLRLIKHE